MKRFIQIDTRWLTKNQICLRTLQNCVANQDMVIVPVLQANQVLPLHKLINLNGIIGSELVEYGEIDQYDVDGSWLGKIYNCLQFSNGLLVSVSNERTDGRTGYQPPDADVSYWSEDGLDIFNHSLVGKTIASVRHGWWAKQKILRIHLTTVCGSSYTLCWCGTNDEPIDLYIGYNRVSPAGYLSDITHALDLVERTTELHATSEGDTYTKYMCGVKMCFSKDDTGWVSTSDCNSGGVEAWSPTMAEALFAEASSAVGYAVCRDMIKF